MFSQAKLRQGCAVKPSGARLQVNQVNQGRKWGMYAISQRWRVGRHLKGSKPHIRPEAGSRVCSGETLRVGSTRGVGSRYWRRGSGTAQTKCRRQSEAACLCISGFFGDKRRRCNPAARANRIVGDRYGRKPAGTSLETWPRRLPLASRMSGLPAIGYAIVRQIQSALKEREVRDGIRLVQ